MHLVASRSGREVVPGPSPVPGTESWIRDDEDIERVLDLGKMRAAQYEKSAQTASSEGDLRGATVATQEVALYRGWLRNDARRTATWIARLHRRFDAMASQELRDASVQDYTDVLRSGSPRAYPHRWQIKASELRPGDIAYQPGRQSDCLIVALRDAPRSQSPYVVWMRCEGESSIGKTGVSGSYVRPVMLIANTLESI